VIANELALCCVLPIAPFARGAPTRKFAL